MRKYWTVCHSVSLPVFQHLHWKTLYSNQPGLKPFRLSLHWHSKQVVIPNKSLVSWGVYYLQVKFMIWWLQFSWSDCLILLFIIRFGWSVNMRSMQNNEPWRMRVGSDISWEKTIQWIDVLNLCTLVVCDVINPPTFRPGIKVTQ